MSGLRAFSFLVVLALASSARANIIDVSQSGFGFTPSAVNVQVGDTVRWTWSSFAHTVSEGTDGIVNGNEAFSGVLDNHNTTFLFTFDAAFVAANPRPGGVYNYFCEPHFPIMLGTVTVNSSTGTPYCFGDGSGTACPCANNSAVGAQVGCLNSLTTGGKLVGSGSASISSDSLVLSGSGMPNSSVLYFQGTATAGGGAGTVFGDGLRCAAGSVIRLGTKVNASGASQYPDVGDQSISVRGANASGNTRMYQAWYRNSAAFCTVSTFNLTNGLQLTWAP
jgi:plastocyanin